MLFATSIYGNIAVAKAGASRAEVEAAAMAANAHGFVSELPQGYDTQARHCLLSFSTQQRRCCAPDVLASC